MRKLFNFERVILLFAIILILTPRYIVFKKYGVGISNDSFEYLSLAHNISKSNQFAINIQLHNLKDNEWLKDSTITQKKFPRNVVTQYPSRNTMFRIPGYAGFISTIFLLFGENFNYIVVFQIILQTLSFILLYLGLKYLLKDYSFASERIKTIIILVPILIFFGLHPGSIICSRNLLRESFEIFLIAMIIYSYSINYKLYGRILMGVSIGILILTLQSFIYILYIIPLLFLIGKILKKHTKLPSFSEINRNLMLPFIIAFTIIQIWCIRNYIQFSHYDLSSYKSGALTMGIMIQSEAEYNKDSVDIKRIIEKYKPQKETETFILDAQKKNDKNNELRRIYRKIYVTSDDSLIKLDNGFKDLAYKILVKNPKILVKNLIRSTYGTYRIDFYFSNLENNSTGSIRYPLSFNRILQNGPSVFDIVAIIMWIVFWIVLIYFFISKAPIFLKILLFIYILPYSFSPSVEERVTVIFNVFIIIGIVYFLATRLNINKKEM